MNEKRIPKRWDKWKGKENKGKRKKEGGMKPFRKKCVKFRLLHDNFK